MRIDIVLSDDMGNKRQIDIGNEWIEPERESKRDCYVSIHEYIGYVS